MTTSTPLRAAAASAAAPLLTVPTAPPTRSAAPAGGMMHTEAPGAPEPEDGASAPGTGGAPPAAAPAPATVLVVDDEPAIVDAVTYNLRQQGYVPLVASDADAALRLFREKRPDVIILDVMLPSGSGFDICRLIRQSGSAVPVLMLTARVAEPDRVHGLEVGADDYLVKPFGMRELMARVKALLRRRRMDADEQRSAAAAANAEGGTAEGEEGGGYAVPAPVKAAMLASQTLGLVVDVEKREVTLADNPLALSRKEFDLLALIASHPGRVFDRQTLLDRVWGEDAYVDDRTVDVHIRWLREKIEPTPGKPQHILTIRGVGYKFQS